MYLDYFGLHELPFSIAPNPRYLYLSHQHQEALAHLTYGLGSAGGVILLTGEVGTGKTTISRKLLEDLPEHIDVAWIVNPRLSATELLASVCDELSISYAATTSSIKVYTDLINANLIEAHGQGRNVVLMIDEAQNLAPEVLEQLRLLTNLETNERKLLQIILLGQPELKTILERTDLRQLAQRITARYHLHSLNKEDCNEYIRHRLAIGGCGRPVFTNKAAASVFQASHGTPRLINLLCDRALLGSYSSNGVMVNVEHVQQATKEIMGNDIHPPKKRWFIAVTIAIALVIANAMLLERIWPWLADNTPTIQVALKHKQAQDKVEQVKLIPHTTVAEVTPEQDQQQKTLLQMNTLQPITQKAVLLAVAPTSPKEVAQWVAQKAAITPALIEPRIKKHIKNAPELDRKEILATNIKTQLSNSIWGVIDKKGDKRLAFQTLAGIWKSSLTGESTQLCDQLKDKKLSCLSQSANAWLLREYNRPAVFQTLSSDGQMRYAVVRAIQKGRVVIQLDQQHWEIPVEELEQHWQGKITFFWLKPKGYKKDMQLGDTGRMVEWLAKEMDAIQGNMIPPQKFNVMNTLLVERLKNFQKAEGLPADGVVGSLTLVRINTHRDQHTPRLTQGELF